jgi:HEAT repeat protein
MGYRQVLGCLWIFMILFSLAGCAGPTPTAATLPSNAPTRAASLTPAPTLTPTPTLLPPVLPLSLPAESDLEAAFSRDWASLVSRLEAAPQGSPEIQSGSKVILVPRTARLAWVQSQLWPEMTAGAGGTDTVYISYNFTRGRELGHQLNYSMSFSTETLEIITSLELFVDHEGQLQQVAVLETTGGEGSVSLVELVRNAVPAQDWLPSEAVEIESQLEAAIGYACGIVLPSDLAYERQVSLLTFALDGPDWAGRRQAAEALGDVRPIAVASAPLLVEHLADSEYMVSHAAEKALEAMLADPRVYELAVAGLESPEALVRRSSLRILAKQTEGRAELLDTVMVLFHDPDSSVRSEAEYWMWPCEPTEIVDRMIAELAGPELERRQAAAQVLNICGSAASGAVHALVDLLQDEDPEMRRRAASALSGIGDRSQFIVDALIRTAHAEADDEAFGGEISAIHYLAGGESAFALLTEAMQSPQAKMRGKVCSLMMDYTDLPGALDLMVAALDDPDASVRIDAAVGLIYFNEAALPVVPKLIAMLADPEPSVSYQVRFALETITNQTFGEDAAAWNAWWEQNQP